MQTSSKRRSIAVTYPLAASAVLAVAVLGCSFRAGASGGAKGGGEGKSSSSTSASGKSSSSASSSSNLKISGGSSGSAKSSASGGSKLSGSASSASSGSGKASGSASASGSGKASGNASLVFKSKPRVTGVTAAAKKRTFVAADLSLKIRAGLSIKVNGQGGGQGTGGTVKDPKPTTPTPTTPVKDPKPTTPTPTTPVKDPKPTTPTPTTPVKDPKPTTPTPTPPVVEPVAPPAEPPENVFGYDEPIRGCFEGIVYPLAPQTPKLPTSYSSFEPISVVYACEWDIPTREWSAGFPGIADHFEWFAIRYTGAFSVANAGKWTFRISSDDGSKLWIDGKVVIDNDGTHPPTVKSGSVELTKGDHDMVLEYFQGPRYHINLQLYATPPGGEEGIFSVR